MPRVLLQFYVPNYDDRLLDSMVAQQLHTWAASPRGKYARRVGKHNHWRSTLIGSQQRIQVLSTMTQAEYTLYLLY